VCILAAKVCCLTSYFKSGNWRRFTEFWYVILHYDDDDNIAITILVGNILIKKIIFVLPHCELDYINQ